MVNMFSRHAFFRCHAFLKEPHYPLHIGIKHQRFRKEHGLRQRSTLFGVFPPHLHEAKTALETPRPHSTEGCQETRAHMHQYLKRLRPSLDNGARPLTRNDGTKTQNVVNPAKRGFGALVFLPQTRRSLSRPPTSTKKATVSRRQPQGHFRHHHHHQRPCEAATGWCFLHPPSPRR